VRVEFGGGEGRGSSGRTRVAGGRGGGELSHTTFEVYEQQRLHAEMMVPSSFSLNK
jgi:hypothetical protein